jgi:oxygen-independent coproporphyrinogen-3 oxidase
LSSIYIHIPYCRQACIYCNFHFSTKLDDKSQLLEALALEIAGRKDYIGSEAVETIYFGGGTPSLLSEKELETILSTIYKHYSIAEDKIEITLEANPDDLSLSKLKELKNAGINRLSIGVQSFKEQDLNWLNRAHAATQSLQCIENAHAVGFENITIDLIYGIPGQHDEEWMHNLEQVRACNLPHFSAYALTVEPKTALQHMIAKGKTTPTDEEQAARHFLLMQDWAIKNSYLAYEISNYCQPGHYSKHNTSYWQGKKYIGIGPSAHSFDIESRQWNLANNVLYTKNLLKGLGYFEREVLSMEQQYNENVMTSLRTMWGTDKNLIKSRFGQQYLDIFEKAASQIDPGLVTVKNDIVYLTMAGKLLADGIASDLFSVNDDEA